MNKKSHEKNKKSDDTRVSKNWLWKKEGNYITIFPKLLPKSPDDVDPHANIGKPFLIIVFLIVVYGYFYIHYDVPNWLDWPSFVVDNFTELSNDK